MLHNSLHELYQRNEMKLLFFFLKYVQKCLAYIKTTNNCLHTKQYANSKSLNQPEFPRGAIKYKRKIRIPDEKNKKVGKKTPEVLSP